MTKKFVGTLLVLCIIGILIVAGTQFAGPAGILPIDPAFTPSSETTTPTIKLRQSVITSLRQKQRRSPPLPFQRSSGSRPQRSGLSTPRTAAGSTASSRSPTTTAP